MLCTRSQVVVVVWVSSSSQSVVGGWRVGPIFLTPLIDRSPGRHETSSSSYYYYYYFCLSAGVEGYFFFFFYSCPSSIQLKKKKKKKGLLYVHDMFVDVVCVLEDLTEHCTAQVLIRFPCRETFLGLCLTSSVSFSDG